MAAQFANGGRGPNGKRWRGSGLPVWRFRILRAPAGPWPNTAPRWKPRNIPRRLRHGMTNVKQPRGAATVHGAAAIDPASHVMPTAPCWGLSGSAFP